MTGEIDILQLSKVRIIAGKKHRMQQPELGQRLTALRKEKNLTQEELVAKSHVSVRTIQRIEAGEVLPRMSTVKILLEALGESMETFQKQTSQTMNTQTQTPHEPYRNILLTAAIAGAVYLVTEIILGAMDVAWLTSEEEWAMWINLIYIGLAVVLVISYFLFARGFIVLSRIFENPLLRAGSYAMIVAVAGISILDVSSLFAKDYEHLFLPYASACVALGALTIIFGVALVRLQDGMGELSRVAGILEILSGCALITVVLFFISYVIMIPALIVEILVLYRGYEYVSRSRPVID